MKLFDDLTECNQLISQFEADGMTHDEIADKIAASGLHPFIKYYAFSYLNAGDHIANLKESNALTEKQANDCFIQMRNYYFRLSGSDNQTFSQLLTLYSEYYAGSYYANEAAAWAESLQTQSLLGASCSLLLNAFQYAVSYLTENPVKSVLFLLLATAVTASAENEVKNNKIVEVIVDAVPPAQPVFMSATDSSSKSGVDSKEMSDLIALKVKIDPNIGNKATSVFKQKCSRLQSHIKTAMKREHHGHITRVLIEPKLRAIYCSDTPSLYLLQGSPSNGLFQFEKGCVNINLDLADEEQIASVSHEMMHADSLYRHVNTRCLTKQHRLSPSKDTEPESIKKWNAAFDMGDKRIEKFYQLWFNRHKNQALTRYENRQLEEYEQAAKGCGLAHSFSTQQSHEVYTYLTSVSKDIESRNMLVDTTISDRVIPSVEVVHVSDYKNGQFRLSLAATNPAQSLFINDAEKRIQLAGYYSNLNAALLLGEREAWTFMYMTPNAAQTFYPEVYALRTNEVEQCATHDLKDLSVHIRVAAFFVDGTSAVEKHDCEALYNAAVDLMRLAPYLEMGEGAIEKLATHSGCARANLLYGVINVNRKDYASACKHLILGHQGGYESIATYIDVVGSCFVDKRIEEAKTQCRLGMKFFEKNADVLIAKSGQEKVSNEMNIFVNNCKAVNGSR
jgi:hypothetical protein